MITPIPAKNAIEYCVNHTEGSVLVSRLINLNVLSGVQAAELITVGVPPAGISYSSVLEAESEPPRQWLVEAVLHHLRSSSDALVICEDSNASSGDPFLKGQGVPEYFRYGETVLWPLLNPKLTSDRIEEMIAWARGWREIIVFAHLPTRFSIGREPTSLTDQELTHIATSASTLVIDVFRGAGYMQFKLETREGDRHVSY